MARGTSTAAIIEPITAEVLHRNQDAFTLLDVRDQHEWDEGHIRQSIHIPFYFIEQRFHEIDLAKPVVVLCASGQRSTIASAILQRHDIPGIHNLVGGIQAWKKAGFGVVRTGKDVTFID